MAGRFIIMKAISSRRKSNINHMFENTRARESFMAIWGCFCGDDQRYLPGIKYKQMQVNNGVDRRTVSTLKILFSN